MAMLRFLAAVCLLFKAVSPKINSNGSTSAVYGGDAHYWCAMDDQRSVRQVTWQRLFPDNSVENLATFSPRFGQQVNEAFAGKVEITAASLGAMSIAVRDVAWGDESCYVCSFNTFPDGSKSRQTCLTVSGISEVTMSHMISDTRTEVDLSCSATGKPAPTLRWEVAPRDGVATEPEEPRQATNGDHTVTTSSRVKLSVPGGWEGRVDCVVNDGAERRSTPLSLRDEDDQTGRSTSHLGTVISVGIVLIVILAAAAVAWKFNRSRCKRKMPQEGV